MNLRIVIHLISILVAFLGGAMLLCIPVGVMMRDPAHYLWSIGGCGLCAGALGGLGLYLSRTKPGCTLKSGVREGFATVAFGWIIAVLVGSIPFIVLGKFYPADAIFETASGFTTTGGSVIDSKLALWNGARLPDGLESLPSCLLFWRGLIVWLGGAGIVMFALVILPFLGVGGATQLYNAEVPGLKTNSDQLTPRITSSAKIIFLVYLTLTVCAILVLAFCGMHWFDAFCHAFSAVATGGFSTKNASMAYYTSPLIQWGTTLFMFLGGCNFALSIKVVVSKRWLIYFQDEEFKFFLSVILTAIGISTIMLLMNTDNIVSMTGQTEASSFFTTLRYSAFQVVSIITSTGFTTADYTQWPAGIGITLFILMLIGGCAGSTSGGMKCVRVLLLAKHAISEIRRCIFPRAMQDIRLNGKRMESATINKTLAFVFLYILTFFMVALFLPLFCKMDMLTAFSASISCISNIGPGFGQVGPASTFSWMSPPAKYLLAFAMVIGRLELYTFLVVLLPSFWKR